MDSLISSAVHRAKASSIGKISGDIPSMFRRIEKKRAHSAGPLVNRDCCKNSVEIWN